MQEQRERDNTETGHLRHDPTVDIPGLKDMAASMDRLAKAVEGTPAQLKEQIDVAQEAKTIGYETGLGHGGCGGFFGGLIVGLWIMGRIMKEAQK